MSSKPVPVWSVQGPRLKLEGHSGLASVIAPGTSLALALGSAGGPGVDH